MKKLFASFIILSVIACNKTADKTNEKTTDQSVQTSVDSTAVNPDPAEVKVNKKSLLETANKDILLALKEKDYKKIAAFIHPEKGVRFSMYAFVDPKEDKVFTKDEFEKYQPTKTLFTWGTMDGSGDLYKATINDYLTKWVYSKDFITGQFSLNEFQGKGNSLNNLKSIYPKADFTENFIKGSEANAGMDWRCLRLVFEEFQGKYYLVGVVNDQWTI